MHTKPKRLGAPLTQWAPRLLLLCTLMLAAGNVHAQNDAPDAADWLGTARTLLAQGDTEAVRAATRALRARPLGAEENVQLALTLFWMGQFEDSARYMRRGLATDLSITEDIGPLASRVPRRDIMPRLNQLAPLVEDNADLCFLTGVLLLMHDDRARALPFLVRAEQLAGTDAQAARLSGDSGIARNVERGTIALRRGEYRDAARAFAFAAADSPQQPEHFVGLAIALAGLGDMQPAAETLDVALKRREPLRLFVWLQQLEARPAGIVEPAVAAINERPADRRKLRLSALLLFAAGNHVSAREACVRVLLEDRLDDFAHELIQFLDDNKLTEGALLFGPGADREPGPDTPDTPSDPEATPRVATLDEVRRHVRRGDFELAVDALDPHVSEASEPAVFFLLFVALVGTGDLEQARLAFTAWFNRVERAERVRLNAVRDLLGTNELFENWQQAILAKRAEDQNAGLPRLLNAWVLVSRGRYHQAREELLVARIEFPDDAVVLALDRILSEDAFQIDVTPDGVPNDPSPMALMGRAAQQFRAGNYEDARHNLLRAAEANPDLPLVNEHLLRVYFAMGDFSNAARTLETLLNRLEDPRQDPRLFRVLIRDGYESGEAFEQHLQELRDECERRPLAAEPFLILGVIEHDRGRNREAAEALQRWHDNVPGRRHHGAVRLFEDVRKRLN